MLILTDLDLYDIPELDLAIQQGGFGSAVTATVLSTPTEAFHTQTEDDTNLGPQRSLTASITQVASSDDPRTSFSPSTGLVGKSRPSSAGSTPGNHKYEVSISMACTRAQLNAVLGTLASVGSKATIKIDQEG